MSNKNLLIIGGVVLVVVIGAVVFMGMGKKGTQTTPTTVNQTETQPAVQGSTVEMSNFAYSPATLKVKAGDKVTFTNKDLPGHSLTSDDGSSFDTRVISQNQSATFTAPSKPGTYSYHCTSHPSIKGTLTVE